MQALRFHGRRDVRIDGVAEPTPVKDQVKIRVEAAGICGSDIHEYRGGPISIPATDPHPLTGDTAPLTLGHEFAGVVVEVGPDVEHLVVGQRVAANAAIWCGECPACRAGATNVCARIGFHGVSGEGGAFAEFDVTRERNLHVLPDVMSTEVGALLEPLATGVHAVRRAALDVNEHDATVLILGGGPIGLSIAMACREAGVTNVVLSEPSDARRSVGATFGATHTIDPRNDDPIGLVNDLTRGQGANAALDAAAGPGTFEVAMGAVRTHGTVVNVAAWEQPVSFNPTSLLFREVTLTGSLAYTTEDFAEAVAIGARNERLLGRMVTSQTTLDDLVSTFERLATSPGGDIKVLVRPAVARG